MSRAFEAAMADRLGGGVRAVATSYGRMAFYYILKALDLAPGGEVVLPALTFWVIPEIARVAGFTPVFADVDPDTFTMTADTLARAVGPRTVAVVPTHLWGLPCDMDPILEIARAHRLAVIEDCAHALGATYRGRPVGSLGDAALFSFQTLKPLNTYGGGLAVARDPGLAERIARLADAEPPPTEQAVRKKLWHGRVQRISIRPSVFTWTLFPVLWASAYLNTNPDVYLWETIRPLDPLPHDYRQRYANVQAALGLEALEHLDRWTTDTQAHAALVTRLLLDVPGARLPSVPADRTHVFYQVLRVLPGPRRDGAAQPEARRRSRDAPCGRVPEAAAAGPVRLGRPRRRSHRARRPDSRLRVVVGRPGLPRRVGRARCRVGRTGESRLDRQKLSGRV